MERTKIVKDAEDFVKHIFRDRSPANNMYHDLTHTCEVVENVLEIGKACKLNHSEVEIVMLAAWFHDIGYVDTTEDHEEQGVEYARNFLAEQDFPREKIDQVSDCILATKIPHNPTNLLQEVMCDADLLHTGKDSFFERNELFRIEFERKTNKVFNEFEWLENNIEFLVGHKFFTEYARKNYEEKKNAHLLKLQKKFRKKLKKAGKDKQPEPIPDSIDPELLDKADIIKKGERGVETMFRNIMRTHVSFSSMADNKANIMISVNTLIITILVSVMIRKLDTNPHLIIPTVLLTVSSMTTLIFAILVTRPKVNEGTFTEDDIKQKKVNLLFFGNFYNMKLDDFRWGMWEMIKDKEYLYDSMIKDFYYLGQVLGIKYKNLRICYNIFMYGLIISVIAFAIAFAMYPEGTNLTPLVE